MRNCLHLHRIGTNSETAGDRRPVRAFKPDQSRPVPVLTVCIAFSINSAMVKRSIFSDHLPFQVDCRTWVAFPAWRDTFREVFLAIRNSSGSPGLAPDRRCREVEAHAFAGPLRRTVLPAIAETVSVRPEIRRVIVGRRSCEKPRRTFAHNCCRP